MHIRITFLIALIYCTLPNFAANGDSIFNPWTIHTLHITYPYSTFYDSLLATNTNDRYLMVQIDFNAEHYDSVGIQAKGNSSFSGPGQKKSFKIDMNEFVRGLDIHGLKKLNFNNSFKDPTMMREKLMNDYLRAHGLPAPRTTYCNVYMNGQLWGLYALVEAVDDEFCKRWFDNKDGNLFQGDPRGDLTWKGSTTQSLYEPNYDLENNSTANDWTDLIHLIDIINNTPDASLYSTLDAYFNTQSFLRQWACTNLFASLDSYIGSGHNYYIYHDTIDDEFEWIAWDNNEAFGSFKNGLSSTQLLNLDMYYISTPATARPLCNKMLLNSTYKNLYNQAYCEMLNNFSNSYFDPKIDSLDSLIRTSVFADPKKTTTNMQYTTNLSSSITITGGPGGGMEVFGLKNFINTRRTAALASLAANSVVCNTTIHEHMPEIGFDIYPSPASQYVFIESTVAIHSPIEIYNMQGARVLEIQMQPENIQRIDVSNLQAGIYMIRCNGKNVKWIKF